MPRAGAGMKNHVVGIVGAGAVGSSVALSLVLKNVADVLICDVDRQRCQGEVMDLQDAAYVTGVHVAEASLEELGRASDVVVITAGAKQLPDEPRTGLLTRNAAVLSAIFSQLKPRPDAVVLLVSNPVDALTMLAQSLCDLPREQVIGSGTCLDSQRLRVALARELDVSVKSVHAYVLGEHGDSQFAAYASARAGGCPLEAGGLGLDEAKLRALESEAKRKAYEIIRRKGATCYGIGAVVSQLCDCILYDKKEIVPLSTYVPELGACVGWPCVLGKGGIASRVPLALAPEEQAKLEASAGLLREAVGTVSGWTPLR